MREVLGSGLDSGPVDYLVSLAGQSNAKSLLQDHRLLHVFWDELRSASGTQRVGKGGWTIDMVLIAHNAVVARTQRLDPDFKHDSPLKAEVSASVQRGIVPMLVIPDYISIVGGRTEGRPGDLDVVVRAKDIPESVGIRIAQALGENVHLIANPTGPHELSYKPLYHLALVPVETWDALLRGETPLSAAMEEFRGSLGPLLLERSLHRPIMVHVGAMRRLVKACTPEEARDLGRQSAVEVLAGLPAPSWAMELVAGGVDWRAIEREAETRYSDAMAPTNSGRRFEGGLRKLWKQLLAWRQNRAFASTDDGLEAARELALSVLQEGEEKQ
jgi:hypothetical protein